MEKTAQKHFTSLYRVKYLLALKKSTVIVLNVVAVCPDGNELGSIEVVKTLTCSKTRYGRGCEKNSFAPAVIATVKSKEATQSLTSP